MKKLKSIIAVIFLLALMIMPLYISSPVQSIPVVNDLTEIDWSNVAGVSTMTINVTDAHYQSTGSFELWSLASNTESCVDGGDIGGGGYFASGSMANKWKINQTLLRFNMASYLALPAGSEILGAKFELSTQSKSVYASTTCLVPMYSVFDLNQAGWTQAQTQMHYYKAHMTPHRISAPKSWWDMHIGFYTSWNIPASQTLFFLTPKTGEGNYRYFCITNECSYMGFDPVINPFVYGEGYSWGFYTSTNSKAHIVIYYTSPAVPPTMTYHTNGAVYPYVLGTENVTSIALSTESCMYANEPLEFDVIGNAGANCTLQLIDKNGSVIDSKNDAVRVGGHYYWKITSIATTYSGFVYCRDTKFNVTSGWVSIQPSVDSTEHNLMIYAGSTVYPQYTTPFSSYLVQRGSLMYIHWKTNIDMAVDDTSLIDLKILLNGDAVNGVKFNDTFQDLNTNYFKGYSYATSTHWRYAIFTPQVISGMETYGGLVNDLAIDPGSYNRGFLEAMIYNNGVELVTCHSAYWYLDSDADGPSAKLSNSSVAVNTLIPVTVKEPVICQAKLYLPAVTSGVVDYSVNSSVAFTASSPDFYVLNIPALTTAGSYTVRTVFSGGYTSYQYITDSSLTVTGAGEASTLPTDSSGGIYLFKGLTDLLKSKGLDSTVGHWIILIVLMVLAIGIGVWSKHRTLTLVLPLLVLAIGIIVGWIDKWVIVLLALGAGLTLFSIFRKKSAGGGEG